MKRLNFLWGAAALIAVTLTASPSAFAQEDDNRDLDGKIVRGPYETNSFGDNWFIGAGGGINTFLNKNFDPKIGISVDGNFGKWFTPAVGMRIGYQGINSQAWSQTSSVLGTNLNTGKDQYQQKFGYQMVPVD